MLGASVGPVFQERLDVSVETLEVVLREVGQMVLQLFDGDQLAVGRHARVLVYTPHHTRS